MKKSQEEFADSGVKNIPSSPVETSSIVLYEYKSQLGVELQKFIGESIDIPMSISILIANYLLMSITQDEVDRRLQRVNKARVKLKNRKLKLADKKKQQLHKTIIQQLDFCDYDLSHLNFSGKSKKDLQDLRGINLRNSLLEKTNFNYTNLKHIACMNIYLEQANYSYSTMDLKLKKALDSFRKCKNNPEQASFVAENASCLFFMHRFGEAVDGFNKAISLASKPPFWYYHTQGKALCNLKRYEEALLAFDKAINAIPRKLRGKVDRSLPYANKGNTLFNLKRYKKALQAYEEALSINPREAEYHERKGTMLFYMKKFEDALESYNNAIDLLKPKVDKPESTPHAHERASCYNSISDTLQKLSRYSEASKASDQAIKLDPENASYLNNKGMILYRMADFPTAVEMYNQAIKLCPIESCYYYNKGLALTGLKEFVPAFVAFDQAVKRTYNDEAYINAREKASHKLDFVQNGNRLYQKAQYQAAIEQYEQGMSIAPDIVYNLKARALRKLKKPREALDTFKINSSDEDDEDFSEPDNLTPRYSEFKSYSCSSPLYSDTEPYDGAEVNDQKDLESRLSPASPTYNNESEVDDFPDSPPYDATAHTIVDESNDSGLIDLDIELAEDNESDIEMKLNKIIPPNFEDQKKPTIDGKSEKIEEKKCDSALEILDKSTETSEHHISFNQTGLILYCSKKYEESLTAFEKAIRFCPKQAEYYINKGKVLYRLKRFPDAAKAFDDAIEIKPNSAFYYYKGRSLEQLNQNDKALEAYKNAIAFDSDYSSDAENPSFYYSKGNVLYRLEDYEKASIAYGKASNLNPKNPVYFNSRGNSLCKLKKYNDAIISFDKAILYDLKNSIYYHNQGIAFLCLGQFAQALKAFDQAIDIMSEKFEYYLNKGYALHHLNDYKEALICFDRAISLNPTDGRAYRYKAEALQVLSVHTYKLALPLDITNHTVINHRIMQLTNQPPFVTEDFLIGLAFDLDSDPFPSNQLNLNLSFEEFKNPKHGKKRKTDNSLPLLSNLDDEVGTCAEENLLSRPSKVVRGLTPDEVNVKRHTSPLRSFASTPTLWKERRKSVNSSSSSLTPQYFQ